MSEKTPALVSVRFIKNAGQHKTGDVVEVSKEMAEALTTPREIHNGTELVPHRVAMTVAEYEKMLAAPVDKGGFTQGELSEMGHKNVVPTPKDPAFEAQLAAKAKLDAEAKEEKAKDEPKAEKPAAVKKDTKTKAEKSEDDSA